MISRTVLQSHYFAELNMLGQGWRRLGNQPLEGTWEVRFSRWHSFLRVSFSVVTWKNVSKRYVTGPAFQVRQAPDASDQ